MKAGWRTNLLIAVILAIAAALRFWGLRWGLPNSLHSYSYHPDEFLTIGAAVIVLSSLFPRFYNYPSLYIYLAALAIAVGSGYGLTNNLAGPYLCARVVTALMGIAAVWVTYWAASCHPRSPFPIPHSPFSNPQSANRRPHPLHRAASRPALALRDCRCAQHTLRRRLPRVRGTGAAARRLARLHPMRRHGRIGRRHQV